MREIISYEHSGYEGRQTFLPVEIDGVSDNPVERISFSSPTSFGIDQNEAAWFAGDQWAIIPRLTLSFGLRFDNDTITSSTHAAPRAGFLLALTLTTSGSDLQFDPGSEFYLQVSGRSR